MIFWIIFYLLLLLLFVLGSFMSGKNKETVIKFYFVLIWFISAFRYMIGVDYEMYMNAFIDDSFINIFENNNDNDVELATYFICVILRNLGFGSQMFFIVYTSITIGVIYIAMKKYSSNNQIFLLAISMYSMMSLPGAYFWSMGVVRQAAAASILFLGSYYWLNGNNKKTIILFLLAYSFHYSAIMVIPLGMIGYWLFKKRITFMKAGFILGVASCATLTGLVANVFFYLLSNVPIYSIKYQGVLQLVRENVVPSFSLTLIILLIFILPSYTFLKEKNDNSYEKKIFICAYVFMLIKVLTSFSLASANSSAASAIDPIIHRADAYMLLFYILFIANWLEKNYNSKNMMIKGMVISCAILVLFGIHSLRQLEFADINSNQYMGLSAGNIEYEFRFNIFDE